RARSAGLDTRRPVPKWTLPQEATCFTSKDTNPGGNASLPPALRQKNTKKITKLRPAFFLWGPPGLSTAFGLRPSLAVAWVRSIEQNSNATSSRKRQESRTAFD